MRMRLLLIILFISVIFNSMHAHPHLKINAMVTIVHGEEGVVGLNMRWIFKDMFGSAVILDYDRDQSDGFDETEAQMIHDDMFINISNFNYFIHLYPGDEEEEYLPIYVVSNFQPEIWNDQLVYNFFVPVDFTAESEEKRLRFEIADPDVYVSYKLLGVSELGYEPENYDFTYLVDRPTAAEAFADPFAQLQIIMVISKDDDVLVSYK